MHTFNSNFSSSSEESFVEREAHEELSSPRNNGWFCVFSFFLGGGAVGAGCVIARSRLSLRSKIEDTVTEDHPACKYLFK